jgi:hypothetical protein
MTRLTLATKQTKTSTGDASDGSVDISAITGDWTVVIEIMGVTGTSPTVQLNFSDSVDAFSNEINRLVASMQGDLGDGVYTPDNFANVKRFTWQKRDVPTARFGVGSAVGKIELKTLGGTNTPGVTFQAWVEY